MGVTRNDNQTDQSIAGDVKSNHEVDSSERDNAVKDGAPHALLQTFKAQSPPPFLFSHFRTECVITFSIDSPSR